ncbi:MAG: caspase family protein [Duncaniella sp.]|nr:caspase family protein [Duncaniella sp.]
MVLPLSAARKVVQDGIEYELFGVNSVKCRAKDKSKLTDVVIPVNIKIDDRTYLVTEIDKDGFRDCKDLKSIEIPKTVTKIGMNAFWNCKSLESVVMPDECNAVVNPGGYGFDNYGIFHGCTSLKRMRGTTKLYPAYMVFEALYECKDVPFYTEVKDLDKNQLEAMTLTSNFYDFASPKVKQTVESWQKRKPYETMAQWEARVNEANRKKMIDETIAEARNEFVKHYAPAALKGTLEDYNAEFGFFPVYLGTMGNVYAYVPQDEAEAFAQHWSDVKLRPHYGVMDNEISVLSCDFELNGKEYKAPTSYSEDSFDDIAMSVIPLSAVREYEQLAEQAKNSPATTGQKVYEPDIVDFDIPQSAQDNINTFAVIIGNENYQRVSKVDFALNDARVFAKYCNRTLGIPEQNIRVYNDATFGDIAAAMNDIAEICRAYQGKAKVIFYYAGHGVPDESNRNAYLLPVDANGSQLETCYALSKIYEQLGDLQAESVVTLIDACFSGSLRGDGMLASARGIKLKPRDVKIGGNMVVISAASGDQTALPYPEKNHGLFTYFLLTKLRASDGDATVGEIADYLSEEVAKQAIVVNKKPQTPDVKHSPTLGDSWKELRLR